MMSMMTYIGVVLLMIVSGATAIGTMKHRTLIRAFRSLSDELGLTVDDTRLIATGSVDGVPVTLELDNLEHASPIEILKKGLLSWHGLVLLFMTAIFVAGRMNWWMIYFWGGGAALEAIGRALNSANGSMRLETAHTNHVEMSATETWLPSTAANILADADEVSTGDKEFDEAITLAGNDLHVASTLDHESRVVIKKAVMDGCTIDAGQVRRSWTKDDLTGIVAQARTLIDVGRRLQPVDDLFDRAMERALHDPNPEVRRQAGYAILRRHPSHTPERLMTTLLAPYEDRPLVEALDEQDATALAALIALSETGAPGDIHEIRTRTEGADDVITEAADKAIATLKARVKGDTAGRVSVATDGAQGGLTVARLAGGVTAIK